MLRSMYSAIAGMKAQQTKLDVVANNIANVGTTSFKASKVNFSDTLYQTSSDATAATANLGGTNSKSVGVGSQVSSINKLMTNGNALTTGRTLDLDIDGDGYFVCTKSTIKGTVGVNATTDNSLSGSNSNVSDTAYTRSGNLSLDANGNLVTSNGYRVMGYYTTTANIQYDTAGTAVSSITGTNPDTATYNTNALSPLVIPDSIKVGSATEAVSSFSIGTDGVITATTSSGKYALGQIAMATFKNPEGLKDLGNNYQQASSNSGSAIIMSSKSNTTVDNSSAFGDIKSGYLEASNVDLTEQFTDMISATRSFQAASKMISNGDDLLQTITGLVR